MTVIRAFFCAYFFFRFYSSFVLVDSFFIIFTGKSACDSTYLFMIVVLFIGYWT